MAARPRYVLILRVLESEPGLSNREVGRILGVGHTGHIWGIMDRLEHRGLVEDLSAREEGRAHRAWCLTSYGGRILGLFAQQGLQASERRHDAFNQRRLKPAPRAQSAEPSRATS